MNSFVVFAACVAAATASPQVLLSNGQLLNGQLLNHQIGYAGHNQVLLNNGQLLNHGIGYSAIPAISQQIVAPLATKTQYHAQDALGQASFGYSYPGQAQAEVRDAAGNVRGSYAYINPNGKEVRVAYTAGHDGFRVASNDLPLGPVSNPNAQVVANLVAPSPVQETPEVIQARAAHAIAHQEALARSGRKKRQAILTNAVIPTTHALGYSSVINHGLGYSAVSNVNGLGYSNVISNVNGLGYSNVISNVNGLGYSNVISHSGLGLNAVAYNTPAATILNNGIYNHGLVQGYSTPVVSNVVAQPLREATLTKVVNNPGHAVSYRVD